MLFFKKIYKIEIKISSKDTFYIDNLPSHFDTENIKNHIQDWLELEYDIKLSKLNLKIFKRSNNSAIAFIQIENIESLNFYFIN